MVSISDYIAAYKELCKLRRLCPKPLYGDRENIANQFFDQSGIQAGCNINEALAQFAQSMGLDFAPFLL
jgi:hypothetical protein